jgi:hypothetical protein
MKKDKDNQPIEFLLNYHHIFELSIESFYEPQSELIKVASHGKDTNAHIRDKKSNNTLKNTPRIKFLESNYY